MKKKRKKKKLLLYNLGNKIKAPSCVRASGPLAESRRQAFGPYCWIRGRTQPVYIYIYIPSQAGKRGLQPFIRRRVASRVSAPGSFCLVRRSDNGEIPPCQATVPCLPVCLSFYDWRQQANAYFFASTNGNELLPILLLGNDRW